MPKRRPSERCPRFTAPRDFRLSQSLQHASPLCPHPTIRTTQHSQYQRRQDSFCNAPPGTSLDITDGFMRILSFSTAQVDELGSVFVFSSLREVRGEIVILLGFKVHCYITIFDCKDCIRIKINLTLGQHEEINSTRGCWPCRQAADMGTIRCELSK